ncbi:hypothetical protein [Luteimonas terrae]|uniref:DUF4426 domain-containing protein n=1 Tax=Luteimonas terrae TaxID=1530191 RepID=A0A4R5U919_9GAMM|nr:hypothetical protein [Luteimonas terrae]TDK31001.1 hypothetical protein E2F49_11760 [Luteimonas terrae]
MLLKTTTVLLCAVMAAACTSRLPADQARWLQPPQAIQLAADAAPRGVAGVFAMQVKAVGATGHVVYLNSEADYRDQRNLTVAVSQAAARQLEARLGAPLTRALDRQRILVRGAARRVRIDFVTEGVLSGKYYYQTHVRVTDAAQIQLQ